jgi:hypothetical protein
MLRRYPAEHVAIDRVGDAGSDAARRSDHDNDTGESSHGTTVRCGTINVDLEYIHTVLRIQYVVGHPLLKRQSFTS